MKDSLDLHEGNADVISFEVFSDAQRKQKKIERAETGNVIPLGTLEGMRKSKEMQMKIQLQNQKEAILDAILDQKKIVSHPLKKKSLE